MTIPPLKTLLLLVGALAVVLYANTLGHGYALDDFPTIYGNRLTMSGFEGIGELLSTAYWYGLDGKNDWLYRPLSMLMFAAEWQLSGGEPWLGHFINVLLYALCSALLLKLLSSLMPRANQWVLLTAVVLWVAHPLHTEVVANIKSRDELLAALFSLLALLFAHRYAIAPTAKNLLITGFSVFTALMAKESAIALLALLPFSLYVFHERLTRHQWPLALAALVPVGIYLWIRSLVLSSQTGGADIPLIDNALAHAPWADRFATALYIQGIYLLKMVWPATLSADYSFNSIPLHSFSNWQVWLSVAAGVLLVFGGIVAAFRRSVIGFGVVFYLVGLVLVSNLFLLTRSTAAERFLFFPSIGLCLAAAFAWQHWFQPILSQRISKRSAERIALASVIIVLLGFSARTLARNTDWKNDTTLFTADVANQPQSARLHFLLGNHVLQELKKGAYAGPAADSAYKVVMNELATAVKIYPAYDQALNGFGEAFTFKGNLPKALKAYEIAAKTGSITSLNNLGNVHFKLGHFDEGIEILQRAIAVDSTYAQAWNNLGTCYFGKQDYENAVRCLKRAFRLSPQYVDAAKNLGSCYGAMNDMPTSTQYFEAAYQLNPADQSTIRYLVMNYRNMGDETKASFYEQKLAVEIPQ